jgi:hypothetical protein
VPTLLLDMKTIMRNYLQSMGVAEDLAEAMFSLPDGDLHYLSNDELIQYRLKSIPKTVP